MALPTNANEIQPRDRRYRRPSAVRRSGRKTSVIVAHACAHKDLSWVGAACDSIMKNRTTEKTSAIKDSHAIGKVGPSPRHIGCILHLCQTAQASAFSIPTRWPGPSWTSLQEIRTPASRARPQRCSAVLVAYGAARPGRRPLAREGGRRSPRRPPRRGGRGTRRRPHTDPLPPGHGVPRRPVESPSTPRPWRRRRQPRAQLVGCTARSAHRRIALSAPRSGPRTRSRGRAVPVCGHGPGRS
jgi:hypothetical protein